MGLTNKRNGDLLPRKVFECLRKERAQKSAVEESVSVPEERKGPKICCGGKCFSA
jgi:hypothetical protein